MSGTANLAIDQFKAVLVGISPMIWQRPLVHSESAIADLHHILQQFHIHGKE